MILLLGILLPVAALVGIWTGACIVWKGLGVPYWPIRKKKEVPEPRLVMTWTSSKAEGHVALVQEPRGMLLVPRERREAMSDKLLNLVVNSALIVLIVVGIVKLLKWAF